MSTYPENKSHKEGFWKIPTNSFDQSEPLDTSRVYDGIINNQEALYNGHFQQRVNWTSRSPLLFGGADSEITSDLRKLISFGPFPINMLKTGDHAPLYVEVACATNYGSAADSTLHVYLRRANMSGRVTESFPEYEPHGLINLSGTTVQWHNLTLPTHGLLNLPPSYVESPDAIPTRISPDDSTITNHSNAPLFMLDIYGQVVASAAYGLKLQGVFARENAWREI